MVLSRREFVLGTLAAVACAKAPIVAPKRANLRFGYAAITWGTNDLLAIQEISELGYPGVQLRANVVNAFVRYPPTLSNLLAQRHLTLVALSSGALSIDAADPERMLNDHLARAKFVHDVGGLFLQVTDERPAGRAVTPDDCAKLATVLNELGRRSAALGVPVAYHPHMGTIGEKPEDSDRVLAATDPKYVKLLLDVAHYRQGGGDPAAAIRRHRDRLALLHLKDVAPAANAAGYRFVELGRGVVDLNGVFASLDEIGFEGWGIVELDSTTEPGRSAKESGAINKAYLESRGFRIA